MSCSDKARTNEAMLHRRTPPLSLDPVPVAKQMELQEAASTQQRLFQENGTGTAASPPQVGLCDSPICN